MQNGAALAQQAQTEYERPISIFERMHDRYDQMLYRGDFEGFRTITLPSLTIDKSDLENEIQAIEAQDIIDELRRTGTSDPSHPEWGERGPRDYHHPDLPISDVAPLRRPLSPDPPDYPSPSSDEGTPVPVYQE